MRHFQLQRHPEGTGRAHQLDRVRQQIGRAARRVNLLSGLVVGAWVFAICWLFVPMLFPPGFWRYGGSWQPVFNLIDVAGPGLLVIGSLGAILLHRWRALRGLQATLDPLSPERQRQALILLRGHPEPAIRDLASSLALKVRIDRPAEISPAPQPPGDGTEVSPGADSEAMNPPIPGRAAGRRRPGHSWHRSRDARSARLTGRRWAG